MFLLAALGLVSVSDELATAESVADSAGMATLTHAERRSVRRTAISDRKAVLASWCALVVLTIALAIAMSPAEPTDQDETIATEAEAG